MSVPFDPVPFDDDPLARAYVDRRRQGLTLMLGTLRQRLETPPIEHAGRALELFRRLDAERQERVLMHPLVHHWWLRLSQRFKDGDAGELEREAPQLGRFVLVPAIEAGLDVDEPLLVAPAPGGELRFPGHPRLVSLDRLGLTSSGPVEAWTHAGELVLCRHGEEAAVPLESLLGRAPAEGAVVAQARVPGTRIDVDASDPWTLELLEHQNRVDPAPGFDRGDLRPAVATAEDVDDLHAALELLAESWPEMRREVGEYVRLVVPFESEQKHAFTNTVWQGAIFLRCAFADPVFTIERIVHECSHLRLNLVMAQERLHEHDWAATVPSPFRKGLRPVTGLYHGAFVFTRVGVAMRRATDLTGDGRYAARIPDIVSRVRESLGTLFPQVRLTPPGRKLLEEIDAIVDELAESVSETSTAAPAIGARS